jgi:hypothetical protein
MLHREELFLSPEDPTAVSLKYMLLTAEAKRDIDPASLHWARAAGAVYQAMRQDTCPDDTTLETIKTDFLKASEYTSKSPSVDPGGETSYRSRAYRGILQASALEIQLECIDGQELSRALVELKQIVHKLGLIALAEYDSVIFKLNDLKPEINRALQLPANERNHTELKQASKLSKVASGITRDLRGFLLELTALAIGLQDDDTRPNNHYVIPAQVHRDELGPKADLIVRHNKEPERLLQVTSHPPKLRLESNDIPIIGPVDLGAGIETAWQDPEGNDFRSFASLRMILAQNDGLPLSDEERNMIRVCRNKILGRTAITRVSSAEYSDEYHCGAA